MDFCFLACSASYQGDDPIATGAAATNAEGTSPSDEEGVEVTPTQDASSHGGNTGAEPLVEEKGESDATSKMDGVSQELPEGKRLLDDREGETDRKKATKEEKAAERLLKAKM